MLRMCNGLAGEAQMEIAGGNVINGHDRKQRGNNAEQVEILHQDHIADASGKAHTAFLCEGTDDQRDHQCQQQRSVLAAGAFRACRISTRCHTNHQQSSQQNRQHRTAERLGFIGSSQRKAFFQEAGASGDTASKADERHIRIQVTGCHTQNHTQRTP